MKQSGPENSKRQSVAIDCNGGIDPVVRPAWRSCHRDEYEWVESLLLS
jgi:hypothetical protein